MRAYAGAKAGLSYADACALTWPSRWLKMASKTVMRWKRKDGDDAYVEQGYVDSLDDFVRFFFQSPDRLVVMKDFFRPPHWGPAFFEAIGYTGPDPLTDKQRALVMY